MDQESKYSPSVDIMRKQIEEKIKQEFEDWSSTNYRVLPLYELAIADHEFSKGHSLLRNTFLHGRWLEYQRINISAKHEAFIFPSNSDFHFYNYQACYKPDQALISRPTFRFSLKNGPGFDKLGVLPIPSDVGLRKSGLMVHTDKPKKKKETIPKLN